jgi:hypothetical protein
MVVLALGAVSSLGTAAFFVRADACWFLRMPASKRPPCCSLSTKTRFTPEGGDCCKHLVLDETVPATEVASTPPIAPSPVASIAFVLPAERAAREGVRPPALARGPPPRPFHPTATTVLRV